MPFYQSGSIKYYGFSSLENRGIYHAVFTRHGGFSPAPWRSLNFGASVGDDPVRVRQNREKALTTKNLNPLIVYDTYQVHSTEIVIADHPLNLNEVHIKADAIITNQPNLTLMMRFADCVPILFFDPIRHAVGIAHAGWVGTVNKIAAKTVGMMIQHFGTQPGDILAAIGPSIGPDHYIVGSDVLEKVSLNFGKDSEQLIRIQDGKSYLDLWKANQMALESVGITRVEIAGICTNCNLEDWFSHRGEQGKTGRFGVVIGLNE